MVIGERLLLRIPEAAAALGISRATTYALIKSGQLPTVTVGHTLRVPVRALQDWIDKQTDAQGKAVA